jgi:hypothetical protein
MLPLLEHDGSLPLGPALPSDTAAIVDAGWTVGPGETLLLAALMGADRQAGVAPSDIGEYEYHNNDVNISLVDLRIDMESYLTKAAARGLQFAAEMLRAAGTPPGTTPLRAIVSLSVDMQHEDFLLQGATVHFTTCRGGYPDWLGDLEGFGNEAIAVIEMEDART